MNHLWAAAAAALPDGLLGASSSCRGCQGVWGLCGIAGPFLTALWRWRGRAGLIVLSMMGMMDVHGGPTPCPTRLGGSELLSLPAELHQLLSCRHCYSSNVHSHCASKLGERSRSFSNHGCSAGLSLLSCAMAVLGCPSSALLALLMVPVLCVSCGDALYEPHHFFHHFLPWACFLWSALVVICPGHLSCVKKAQTSSQLLPSDPSTSALLGKGGVFTPLLLLGHRLCPSLLDVRLW